MYKNLISFLFFIITSLTAFAQTAGYNFYSNLDSIKSSGFYSIVLSPQINAHLKTDYSDVRLINKNDKWIPHVFHSPFFEMSREVVMFDINFTTVESNKNNTVLIMEATQLLNNINVLINNTEVQKYCTLSGSSDKQNWFVISDSILLTPHPADKNTESNLKINFPRSNYSYLKLVISNRNKDPYNVVGVTSTGIAQGFLFPNFSDSVMQNPQTVVLQKDSNKISYVQIIQQQQFHFNQIIIKVEGVKYYSRKVDLYVPDYNSTSYSYPGKFIQSFTVSNNSNLQITVPVLHADIFYLVVNNEDNPAFQISGVRTGLNYRYITAYLEKGKTYRLLLDNKEATFPTYDITKDYPTIKDSVPSLNAGSIIAFKNREGFKENNSRDKKWIIWICIIVTLLVLLFFTKSLMKEVSKKNLI